MTDKGCGFIPDLYTPDEASHTTLTYEMVGADYIVRSPRPVDSDKLIELADALPVKDQGPSSSCVGQAYTGALELRSAYEAVTGLRSTGLPRLSGLAAYTGGRRRAAGSWAAALSDFGSRPADVAEFLREFGVVTERRWPMDMKEVNTNLPLDVLQHGYDARIERYGFVSLHLLDQTLASGFPVVCAIPVDAAFMDGASEIHEIVPPYTGHHMICLAGYSMSHGAQTYYRLINSWGSEWGDGGRAWIRRSVLEQLGSSFRSIILTPDTAT